MKLTTYRALFLGFTLTLVLVANPRPSWAGDDDNEVKLIGAITVPGNPLAGDISYVDQRREKYYFADVSNKGVDVFDSENSTFLGRVSGNFHGLPTPTEIAACGGPPGFDARGPSGVLVANDDRLWVTDFTGSSGVVKVFELEGAAPPFTTVTPSATIVVSQAKCRADEEAFDPEDRVVIVGFPEPETGGTPFVAFISSDPPYSILGTLQFPGAAGMEQSVWDTKLHRFLVNVPGIGIVVINPKDLDEFEKIYPGTEPSCGGAGLALGPLQHLLVGCSGGPDLIMDAVTGSILTTFSVSEVAKSDEVWFNEGDGNFYASSNFTSPAPALAVIDAETDTFLQDVPTAFGSHSVAAFRENNHIFVPIQWVPGKPDVCYLTFGTLTTPGHGCVFVFANQSNKGDDGGRVH